MKRVKRLNLCFCTTTYSWGMHHICSMSVFVTHNHIAQTCCRVAQLSAHNKRILVVPIWATHTTPPPLYTHLHSPLSVLEASNKTNTAMSAVGGYSVCIECGHPTHNTKVLYTELTTTRISAFCMPTLLHKIITWTSHSSIIRMGAVWHNIAYLIRVVLTVQQGRLSSSAGYVAKINWTTSFTKPGTTIGVEICIPCIQ